MKIAIITAAGISSRFNEGIPEAEKKLKTVYFEGGSSNTLLYHLLKKCAYADRIVVVGGYKFDVLKEYCLGLESGLRDKIIFVYNEHFEDLASGYSLYLGLKETFKSLVDEVLFVEGDLDIDDESFEKVVQEKTNVLTFNYELIYANKAVILYQDDEGRYRYVFNSRHGLLSIDTPFEFILNSGQVWKFIDVKRLEAASEKFYAEGKGETNLKIIQNYINSCESEDFECIGLKRWTNCNTRTDYQKILSYWEKEK